MADQTSRRYLFVAIDRATRWVFIRIYSTKTAANARRFPRDMGSGLAPFASEPYSRTMGRSSPTVSLACASANKAENMSSTGSPQTNGMFERFNGRIEDVLQSHHFRSGEEPETTLHRYVWLYNQQLPQSALGSKTPLQAMKNWHKLKPELFNKHPYYRRM